MTTTITIANPILHGMHPDPSWIWDDDLRQIVLVTSTFELVPGLPIYVSRDMAHWKHVSDAIDEELARRLLIPFVDDSGGVYAPTLRRIRGKYVIACTIARINGRKAIAEGCSQAELDAAQAAEGNFVLESDSIDGPWRGPFWIEGAEGIDPDIFEDEDGNVYWTQTRPAVNPQWEGQTEVWTRRINPKTWTFVNDGRPAGTGKTVLWRGYGVEAVWAEAPHLYRVGDYVYLMTAEGGTSFEHSEMAMRIYAPHGLLQAFDVYEREASEAGERIPQIRDGERCYLGVAVRAFHADKKNPILTHRHLGLSESLQCVGHADLMFHPELGWWMVCLGVRETRGKNDGELLSYLGRESFVTPVSWEHNPADWKLDGAGASSIHEGDPGWPVTCAGLGRLADEITVTVNDEGGIAIEPRIKSSFSGDMEPVLVNVADDSTNGMVVRDERDISYRRIAKLPTLMPIPMSGSLVIRQNSTHYAVFSMHGTDVRYETVNGDDSQAGSVAALRADGTRPAVLFDDNRLSVIVTGMHGLVDSATFVRQGQVLLSVDARFLSTEWAGGFVGCMAGFMA
ncbi:glycoside hydrolase family 43 protein [Bifidobacterium adolescentis]|uniref:glycoside hydrolase family 43 protein n=1 Tax=Bifidobacterium adolescentis TaxID=1680 RepID=UPI00189C0FD5|nr:glycoside hydrolase family 43 protein [Bifidobacterium adolescentis]MDB0598111.1 glycoside hydrolase family 43 protein [Bifidobacterium adolescentis]MDB1546807.1 glycoside hydrolase family 43 protein [Bifidobacterium adolescentis]MDB1556676.1 glycoside hydrolase family 43 protein [Bifidobacterium adolescentis]